MSDLSNRQLYVVLLLASVLLYLIAQTGCATSRSTIDYADGTSVKNTRVTLFRKGVAENVTAIAPDGSLYQRQAVCDESMSGNLGYAAVGLGAIVAGPLGAAAAGAGVAATEYAKAQNPDFDHAQYLCEVVLPAEPESQEEADTE